MGRNRFQAMSGCYTCRVCGKRTRETGHDESSCELCAFCYIESGLENHHNDCGGCDGGYDPSCPICNTVRENQVAWLCKTYGVQPPKGEHFLKGEEPQSPVGHRKLTLGERINRGEFQGNADRLRFRTALEIEFGVTGHPKAQRLWELAWEHGHANGYMEVMGYYEDFKALIEEVE